MMITRHIAWILLLSAAWAWSGCAVKHEVEVQPIKVEPIQITVDVNLRVERELDDFFDYQKKAPAPPASAPDAKSNDGGAS